MNPLRLTKVVVLCSCTVCTGQGVVPGIWFTRTAPSSNTLNSVSYANGTFLVAGAQGTLLTSADGTNWLAQNSGVTTSFLCAGYGRLRYALGGSGDGLILLSPDAVSWTSVLPTTGLEVVFGFTGDGGTFSAALWNSATSKNYLLSSTDGSNWAPTSLPTTNELFAIARGLNLSSAGTSVPLLVAAGDRGTILTSSNGVDWAVLSSGTTAALRAAVYHQGRMLVAGDSGVVLASSDGVTWSLAATLAFDIRGLASSGNAIVAVGENWAGGCIEGSTNGLSWTAGVLQFAQPLRAVAYGKSSFIAVGDSGLILQSTNAPDASVNAWTKTTSGYWGEPYWSAGRLPTSDQGLITFTNAGWKALAIGEGATANFSNSLSVNLLLVEAPAGSFNTLLLNYAGTEVPLKANTLTLGPNASLTSYHSALSAGTMYLNGPTAFSESSVVTAGGIELASSLGLTNTTANLGLLYIGTNAVVAQSGGVSQLSFGVMNANSSFTFDSGWLTVHQLCVQAHPDFPSGFSFSPGLARFVQARGNLTADVISLGNAAPVGEFDLQSGTVEAGELRFYDGRFVQNGGTNTSALISLPAGIGGLADYSLSGGTLISSNVTLGYIEYLNEYFGKFEQSGGTHTSQTMRLLGYLYDPYPGGYNYVYRAGSYTLTGGLLQSGSLGVDGGSFIQNGGTNETQSLEVSQGGSYALENGQLSTTSTSIGGYQQALWSPSGCTPTTVFTQSNGTHSVSGLLELGYFARYTLQAGTLLARDISIGPVASLNCVSGTVSNSETLTLYQGGTFYAGEQVHHLGQLQLWAVTNNYWCGNPAGLYLTGSAALRLRDSHEQLWSAPQLQVAGWRAGTSHIYFGDNAQGLTPGQLKVIVFVDPVNWPAGSYPAQLLATGELVPAALPPITYTQAPHNLILSWATNCQLLSATNVAGPYLPVTGAANPFTNRYDEPARYFRLSLP